MDTIIPSISRQGIENKTEQHDNLKFISFHFFTFLCFLIFRFSNLSQITMTLRNQVFVIKIPCCAIL